MFHCRLLHNMNLSLDTEMNLQQDPRPQQAEEYFIKDIEICDGQPLTDIVQTRGLCLGSLPERRQVSLSQ